MTSTIIAIIPNHKTKPNNNTSTLAISSKTWEETGFLPGKVRLVEVEGAKEVKSQNSMRT